MVENERTKRPLASGKDRMSGKILKIEILGLLPLWMRAFFQKKSRIRSKKFFDLFFVPNHSIRENKVRKVDFDEKNKEFHFLYCLIWHLAIFEAENQLFQYVILYIV